MVSINPESIKKIANFAGDKFNKVMASGSAPEGSIFDAASKLGIKNTDDLKSAFAKVKENPMEEISGALNKLHDSGFRLGQRNANAAQETNKTETAKTETKNTVVKASTVENEVTDKVDTSEETTVQEETQKTDNSAFESVKNTLKKAGLDIGDKEVQSNLAKFVDNPAKLKEFIAQKLGIGGGAEESTSMQLDA